MVFNRAAIAKRGWVYRPRLVAPGLGLSPILSQGLAPLLLNMGLMYPLGACVLSPSSGPLDTTVRRGGWGCASCLEWLPCSPEARTDELVKPGRERPELAREAPRC